MKNNRIKSPNISLLVLLMALVCVFQTNAQIYIEQSGADLSELDVTEYDRELILSTTQNLLNRYADDATFLSDAGTFSDEKYANFLGLFSGGARVYNDVAKKDGDNIEYAVYADNIYQHMQGTGVKFELNDIYLERIRYDSSGFYQVTLKMEKLMLNGLNENNVPVNYNNGIPFALTMRIEMPDYDIEQATILSLLGESRKIRVKKSSMISLDGFYSFGLVSKTPNIVDPGFAAGEFPINYSSYGVESLYKISLNNSKTLWGVIGVQAGFHNYEIDLLGYNGLGEKGDEIGYEIGGAGLDKTTGARGSDEANAYSLLLNDVESFGEKLRVIAIEVPIGISYNLSTSYNYDFFIDAAIVPYYSVASDGAFYSDNLRYFSIPDDTLKFPQAIVDYVIDNEIEEYIETKETFDNKTTATQNFSVGVLLSPTFHYKFNYKMALEIGANVQYNFLPMFATGHKDGEEGQNFLAYLNGTESVYTSTIQHYFENVGLIRYGLKVGIVFKL